MDPVTQAFEAITWKFATRDPASCDALAERIAETGRKRALITYSELVKDHTFHLGNLQQPQHRIDILDWQELDRAIVGDFLGYLAMRSYEEAGFFSSALVVGKRDGSPGEGFYNLLKQLGLIKSSRTDKAMYLWAEHVAKAHTWYARD